MKLDIEINAEDVLEQISEADVIAYYGADSLLKEIGQDEAVEYFGL